MPNGTYYFQFNRTGTPNVYIAASPANGYISIFGFNYTLNVRYTMYAINTTSYFYFQVFGIPAGTLWHLTIDNLTGNSSTEYNSTGHWKNITLWAGDTYTYTGTAANYSVVGPVSIYVDGNVYNIWVRFSQNIGSGPSNFLAEGLALIGISVISFWTVLMAAVAIIGIILSVRLDAPINVTIAVPVMVLFMGYGFNVIGILVPAVSPFAGAAAYYLEKREPGGERGR